MYILQLLLGNDGTLSREGLLNVAAFIVALLAALILHEIAHGAVAYMFGDDTAKVSGRLSLNPLKHLDWMGLVMMLFVGFGWARPVPVNVSKMKNQRLGMICVSLAGIVTNLLLSFVFSLFYVLLYTRGVTLFDSAYYLAYFLNEFFALMVTMNVSFALFNVLPLFPLDGYRFISCFVPQENGFMRFLRRYSFYFMIALIILDFFPTFSPLEWYVGKVGNAIVNGFLSLWSGIL